MLSLFIGSLGAHRLPSTQVSQPREPPPQPLVEPDVNLSIYPAPTIQPYLGGCPRIQPKTGQTTWQIINP